MQPIRARASSVIVHRVAPGDREAFAAWQKTIAEAASTYPGYQETDLYPPDAPHDPWVVVIHFDDAAKLKAWLDSPLRAEHLSRYSATNTNEFELKNLPRGLGDWFTQTSTPRWKTMLTVLCGLYPTVAILTKALAPFTSPLGFALALLVGNVVSVVLMDVIVMPLLTKILGQWLPNKEARGNAMGLFAIVGVIASITLVFKHFWG